jgi:membrane-associated phospholipid phosphatase
MLSPVRLATFSGTPFVRTVVVVEAAAALVVAGHWRRALFLAGTVGGTGALNSGLKRVIRRRRPKPALHVARPSSSSFPSGHASGSVALAGSAAYVAWLGTRSVPVTAAVALAGTAWAGAVGYSRVKLARHHISDVAGGYALGALCLIAASVLCRQSPPSRATGSVSDVA